MHVRHGPSYQDARFSRIKNNLPFKISSSEGKYDTVNDLKDKARHHPCFKVFWLLSIWILPHTDSDILK